MSKQPLLLLCVSFILGIFLQDVVRWSVFKIYCFVVICFVSLIVYFVRNFYVHRCRHFSILLFAFAAGILVHSFSLKEQSLPDLKGRNLIYFKLNQKLNSNEKNRRYEITAWKDKREFRSILSMPKEESELNFNHYYKAEAYVNRVQQAYSDFQFDYAKYLSRRGIFHQSYLPNSFSQGTRKDLSFAEKIRQQRLETLSKIDNLKLSKKAREFTKGIILADRTEMDKETVQDFSRSGLMHVLAISGSHMAIFFWLILGVLYPFFSSKFRKFKIVFALLLIWSFAVFIDYGSSVMRSCIMISCYYIYVLLQRKPDLLHAMAIAALLILMVDTNQLFDVGFQLSFVAVLGIFWLNGPILQHLPKPKSKLQIFLVNVVSVSFAAQLATLPLVLFYFHQWSFVSIPANLLIIPAAELIIIFALLMTVLAAFSMQWLWLNEWYDFVVSWVLKLIGFFAHVDSAYFTMIPMNLLEVMVAFLAIYFLRFPLRRFRIKSASVFAYFLILFLALRAFLNYRATQLDEVLVHRYFKERVISVKQKDQVAFLIPEQVDQNKILAYIIEPYLTSRRTNKYMIKVVPKDLESITIHGSVYSLIDDQ